MKTGYHGCRNGWHGNTGRLSRTVSIPYITLKRTERAHQCVFHSLIRPVDHVIDMRRQLFRLFFETGTWEPPRKVHVYAIGLMRAGLLITDNTSDPQKGSMSNVQPVIDAASTACNAFSAKETYGSSCGAMSMPYAMPMITCPDMLQCDVVMSR